MLKIGKQYYIGSAMFNGLKIFSNINYQIIGKKSYGATLYTYYPDKKAC